MRVTDAETIYVFIKNESDLSATFTLLNHRVRMVSKFYKRNNIIRKPDYFAEIYIPFIQREIFTFLKQQKTLKDPYKFPSKKAMMDAAKIFANEAING